MFDDLQERCVRKREDDESKLVVRKKSRRFKYEVDLTEDKPCENSYWDWLPELVKSKIYRYERLMTAWDKRHLHKELLTLPRCKVHGYVSTNQRSFKKK